VDRPAGLFLDDRRAQSSADAKIIDLQAGEIAASQFAVDRQIEHCETAPTRLYLKAGPDIPDVLRLPKLTIGSRGYRTLTVSELAEEIDRA
jgi:hypothetical protein